MDIIYLVPVLSLVFFVTCVCSVCLCLCSKAKQANVRQQQRANQIYTTHNDDHNPYSTTIIEHSCHPIIINNFNHCPYIDNEFKPLNNFETPPPSYLEVTGDLYNQYSRHFSHHICYSGVESHNDGVHGTCSKGDGRDTDGGGTCDTGDNGGGDSGGCDTGGGNSGCCDTGGGDGGGCDSGGTD